MEDVVRPVLVDDLPQVFEIKRRISFSGTGEKSDTRIEEILRVRLCPGGAGQYVAVDSVRLKALRKMINPGLDPAPLELSERMQHADLRTSRRLPDRRGSCRVDEVTISILNQLGRHDWAEFSVAYGLMGEAFNMPGIRKILMHGPPARSDAPRPADGIIGHKMHWRFVKARIARIPRNSQKNEGSERLGALVKTASRCGFLALISIAACRYTCAQEPVSGLASRASSVGLAPGDTIEAHFIDFPEASDLRLTVSPQGNLFVPYVGPVKVAGMMPDEAQGAIVEALKKKDVVAEPQVALTVLTARNLSAVVVGEVTQPHPVPLFSPLPLSAVLSQVGGFTQMANYHILISHSDGRPVTEVELDNSFRDVSGKDTDVVPGDVVDVLRANTFYALGELQKPGMFPMIGTLHLSLLQAIATAGGVTNTAQLSGLRVFRRQKDGSRLELTVDFGKLSKGQAPDMLVQADDIIYVPRSGSRVLYNNVLSQSLYAAIIAASYFR